MKNVHEYSVDRATNSARLGATNPTRKYIRGPVDERAPIIVQLAKGEVAFYDQGGQPIQLADVPQDVLDALQTNPIRRGTETVEAVLRFCEFCPGGKDNPANAISSNEYEKHLINEHIRKGAISARPVEPEPEDEADEPTAVEAAPAPQCSRRAPSKAPKKTAKKAARKARK